MDVLFYIAVVVVPLLWLKKLWDGVRDAAEVPPRSTDFSAPRRRQTPAGVPPLTSPERARYELEKTRARRAQAQRQRVSVRRVPPSPQVAQETPVFQTRGLIYVGAGGAMPHTLPPMPAPSAPQAAAQAEAEAPHPEPTLSAPAPSAPTLEGDLCGAPSFCERETRACLTRDAARAALASPESARRVFALQEILRPPLSARPNAFLAFPFER